MTHAATGGRALPDLLLPVGFSIGFRLDADGSGDAVLEIRLGRDFVPVTPSEHDVWWRCRWLPGPGELLAWARSNDIEGPAATVESLRSDGLLVHVSKDSWDPFVATHRVLPMGLGTGADGDGELFTIRNQGLEPLVTLDAITYMAWGMCDGYRTIREVAGDLAGALALDAAVLEACFVERLPVLLEVGVATLDRAESRR